MISTRRAGLLLAALLSAGPLAVAPSLLPGAGEACAAEPGDDWFGGDKAAHLGVTLGIGAGGYALGAGVIGTGALDSRWAGMALGGALGLGLGALKEGLDAAGLGSPSYKDFVWDVVGTALGLGLAVTFDAAWRGPLR